MSQRAEASPVLPALSRFAATRRSNVKATLIPRSPALSPAFYTPRSHWPRSFTDSATITFGLLFKAPFFFQSQSPSLFSISRPSPGCNSLSFPLLLPPGSGSVSTLASLALRYSLSLELILFLPVKPLSSLCPVPFFSSYLLGVHSRGTKSEKAVCGRYPQLDSAVRCSLFQNFRRKAAAVGCRASSLSYVISGETFHAPTLSRVNRRRIMGLRLKEYARSSYLRRCSKAERLRNVNCCLFLSGHLLYSILKRRQKSL